MANRDWQERGVRVGGAVLSEEEATALVEELRKRIEDPQIANEAAQVLRGERETLSPRARAALLAIAASLVMMHRK